MRPQLPVATSSRPTLGHLRALDGIRALAVLAVVLYHGGVPLLHGGFLGVDVFFVLSGFLITSLLLTELQGTGRLGFARFYERRARRLLPALVVLVLLVAAFAFFVVPHATYQALPGQVVGTMLYVGNWTLIASHSTYFTMWRPPLPLQHTWSLAIEEQFYLVWPAVLWCLWRVTHARRVLATIALGGAVACGVVTAMRFDGAASVNGLYFATQTHATGMLVGAALAFLLLSRDGSADGTFGRATGTARAAGNVLGVVAWAATVVAFFAVKGFLPALYTGGYLVFALVVATAIAATVLVPDGLAARALSLGAVVFVGQISYGVYLFHFPLFLWIDHERTGLSGVALLGVRLAVTVGVATASYAVVERPIRERRFLRGWAGLATSTGAFVAAGTLAFFVTTAAAAAPHADVIAKHNAHRHAPRGATTRVLVFGDSMALTLANGLNTPAARAAGVYFGDHGLGDCSLVGGRMRAKDIQVLTPRRCNVHSVRGWPTHWAAVVRTSHPALSMVLFRMDIVDHKLHGRWSHVGRPGFDCLLEARLREAISVLASTGRPVVLLTTPFYDTGEQPDGAPWPEDAPRRAERYNALLREVASEYPGVVTVVDLSKLVSPEGRYTRTIGSTVVRWIDGVHLTFGGDALVLPGVLPSIERLAGTTPTPTELARVRDASPTTALTSCAARSSTSAVVG